MTSASINPNAVLSVDPSSDRTAWALLDDDEQILETGRWTAGGCIGQELHELLVRVQPGQVLIVLHGGPDRACDVVAALELVQACERWAADIEAAGAGRTGDVSVFLDVVQLCERWAGDIDATSGDRPEVVALMATHGNVGGVVEAARWWIQEQRAGAPILAGIQNMEGGRDA